MDCTVKSKKGVEVTAAVDKIFINRRIYYKSIKGKTFYNTNFEILSKKYYIKMFLLI